MHTTPRNYVGEIVKIRTTEQLAVIVADNYAAESRYALCMVTLRYLDGRDEQHRFIDVDTYPAGLDVLVFRAQAMRKFPELPIV